MPSDGSFVRRVVVALALVALAVALVRIADVLLVAFGGVLLAIALRAGGDALARRLPLSPRWGTVLLLLLVVAAIALLVLAVGAEIERQVGDFRQRLPAAMAVLKQRITGTPVGDVLLPALQQAMQGGAGSGAMKAASATLGGLSNLFIVLVLAVYLSLDPGPYARGVVALVPPRHQPEARATLAETGHALRRWLLGQLLSMVCVGILTGLGLWIVGVPNALVLGVIAGLFEFVPVIGTFAAAIPILLLALASGPQVLLYAALVYFTVQQLEGALIMPLAQRWAVHLPPAVLFFSVVAFGVLFGLPGLLFATPLAVVIMVLVRRFYLDRRPEAPRSGPP